MNLFKLHGDLTSRTAFVLSVCGIGVVLLIWLLLTSGADPILPSAILPHPSRLMDAFSDLYHDNDIVRNTCLSIGLNLAGYVEAIAFAVPIGFLIGLLPIFRGGFKFQVDAIRYVPLTAVTALFIVWFGIGTTMKVHFLAFGILIYLLPVMIQRIDEVDDVYVKTVYTIGANAWQTFRTVYIPSVISRVSDDIRVLTAISWTYIIVAESINSEGGIGALIWRVGMRQSRVDKVFAMLLIIMLIGVLQDRFLLWLDKHLFPYKYQSKDHEKAGLLKQQSAFSMLLDYAMTTLVWMLAAVYLVLLVNELTGFFGGRPLVYLFGGTVWVIHVIVIALMLYFGLKFVRRRMGKEIKPEVAA